MENIVLLARKCGLTGQTSLRYQWMHSRDWTKMAEEGDPLVMVEGKGIRVKAYAHLKRKGGGDGGHTGYRLWTQRHCAGRPWSTPGRMSATGCRWL